ncbi:MAG: matrixin family metalloprotease [Patescibacteria group bacterium]|jgi:hypothetical protein
MKNIITRNFFLSIIAAVFVIAAIISTTHNTQAYSYAGFKWYSYPVSVDMSDASLPGSWTTPIANAMSAWNAASSPFYFNVGYSGHLITLENKGAGYAARSRVSGSGDQITDIDLVFNTYYSWSTSGGAGAFDVQNIATHEFGHWLALNDLSGAGNTEKTMYYQAAYGETKKRTLESDDLNGINYIYP